MHHVATPSPATSPLPLLGDLVDEKEAAALLVVAVGTIRNWRAKKMGPRWVRVGQRMVRYSRTDLAAFLASSQAA